MTSRVQKGGPIFRPVVKSRTRLDARQPSVNGDASSGETPSATPSFSSSMPPPQTLPERATPAPVTAPPLPEVVQSGSQRSIPPPSRPPTLGTPIIPNLASRQTRTTPAPPMLLTQTVPTPNAVGPTPQGPSTSINAPTTSLRPSQSHVLHHSGAENVPRLSLNAEVTVKPHGTTRRKKAAAEPNEPGEDSHPEPESAQPQPSKPTRQRKSSRVGTSPKPQTKRKRKSTTASDEESGDDETGTTEKRRQRRASSGTPRPRRSRAPSLPPFDPDADPGEEIDPTVVTMASLCTDTGQGRVSRKAAEILSNHAAWKAQNREKRARMKSLMELKKYGREEEAEDGDAAEGQSTSARGTPVSGGSNALALTANNPILDDTGSGFDYSQNLETSRYTVQVRIGPNGETIIDEESLVVDRTEVEDTTTYTHVVESDHTKFVNSGSYGKRYRGSRWSAEETEMFYDALSQYGENYELIAYVLPGRDRKSCKNKFKAEDKKNPARINYCLSNNTPVDMATLSRMTGKDFSGPVPEIRVPTPQPILEPDPTVDRPSPPPEPVRKKNRKLKAPDDGVVIVGEADSFVPFPSSP